MSSVPTGTVVPSMVASLVARRWARVTPRVRSPTKARSLAPPLRSRISCEIRVRARSSAASSRTCAFSRRRGAPVMTSPCEPHGTRLKEEQRREFTLRARSRSCQRLVSGGQQSHQLIKIDRFGQVGIEAGGDRLPYVLGLAVAGERDEACAGQGLAGPQPARDLHPIDVR